MNGVRAIIVLAPLFSVQLQAMPSILQEAVFLNSRKFQGAHEDSRQMLVLVLQRLPIFPTSHTDKMLLDVFTVFPNWQLILTGYVQYRPLIHSPMFL
jgi:hypothetical protein